MQCRGGATLYIGNHTNSLVAFYCGSACGIVFICELTSWFLCPPHRPIPPRRRSVLLPLRRNRQGPGLLRYQPWLLLFWCVRVLWLVVGGAGWIFYGRHLFVGGLIVYTVIF